MTWMESSRLTGAGRGTHELDPYNKRQPGMEYTQ